MRIFQMNLDDPASELGKIDSTGEIDNTAKAVQDYIALITGVIQPFKVTPIESAIPDTPVKLYLIETFDEDNEPVLFGFCDGPVDFTTPPALRTGQMWAARNVETEPEIVSIDATYEALDELIRSEGIDAKVINISQLVRGARPKGWNDNYAVVIQDRQGVTQIWGFCSKLPKAQKQSISARDRKSRIELYLDTTPHIAYLPVGWNIVPEYQFNHPSKHLPDQLQQTLTPNILAARGAMLECIMMLIMRERISDIQIVEAVWAAAQANDSGMGASYVFREWFKSSSMASIYSDRFYRKLYSELLNCLSDVETQ